MVWHPELGSDPPIGSDRDSGCDSICARFDKRETSVLYKPSTNGKTSPSVISQGDLGGPSNKLIHIVWIWSSKISEGASGRPHRSSIHYP